MSATDEMERVARELAHKWTKCGHIMPESPAHTWSCHRATEAIAAALRAARAGGREEMRSEAIAACDGALPEAGTYQQDYTIESCKDAIRSLPLAPPKEK